MKTIRARSTSQDALVHSSDNDEDVVAATTNWLVSRTILGEDISKLVMSETVSGDLPLQTKQPLRALQRMEQGAAIKFDP